MTDKDKEEVRHAFKPRVVSSLKSLPVPGGDGNLSSSSSADGSENSDDGGPLACSESLPLQPQSTPDDGSDKNDPLTCHESLGDFDASTVESTSDIEQNLSAATTGRPDLANNSRDVYQLSKSGGETEDSSQIHLELKPSKLVPRSHQLPVPFGSSASKPEQFRKRASKGRSLPTAASRKSQKKPRLGEISESDVTREQVRKEVAYLLNSSTQLAYSWDSLGVGEELGSADLNRYMTRLREQGGVGGPETTPDLTVQETLQIMTSLRVRTLLPPPKSYLHKVVQRNRFENRLALYGSSGLGWGIDEVGAKSGNPADAEECRLPKKTLARLYEVMCAQDADDGLSNRREAQYLSAEATIERLRSLENKACELKLNEAEVLGKGRELGLLKPIHRSIPRYAEVKYRGQNTESMYGRADPMDRPNKR